MTALLYQPTPSMDRSPGGWVVGTAPMPEGAKLLGRFATAADALAVREAAMMLHALHRAPVTAALAHYKAVDAPAHQRRRDMERLARDTYVAETEPARRAWLELEAKQRAAALACLPPLEATG